MKRCLWIFLCVVLLPVFTVGCGVQDSEVVKHISDIPSSAADSSRFTVSDSHGNVIVTEDNLILVEKDYSSEVYGLILEFDDSGTEAVKKATEENIGGYLSVCCDGVLLSKPTVHDAITDGRLMITGFETAQELSEAFNMISAVMHGEES